VNVYPSNEPERTQRMYALTDDQINKTLTTPRFFYSFNLDGQTLTYTPSSCNGTITLTGRTAEGFVIEPILGDQILYLPKMLKCGQISYNTSEIPTPNIAKAYSHLCDNTSDLPEIDYYTENALLIG
jgi:hypothetical protein